MTSARGIKRERQVRAIMDADGWFTTRAAGSLGDADIIAMRPRPQGGADVRLVEVKSTAQGPFEHFGPADRAALISAAVRAGGVPVLAYWPSRGGLRWLEVFEWPAERSTKDSDA